MAVIDIDLDLFVDPRPEHRSESGRLESEEYTPWSLGRLAAYLSKHCGLSPKRPLPGAMVEHHHEVFYKWRELIRRGELQTPFDVFHLDSHADLGMGWMDASVAHIQFEFLHLPLEQRLEPPTSGSGSLGPGNYLLYAIANRWIRSLSYIHHADLQGDNMGLHDIPNALFENCDPESANLVLKRYPVALRRSIDRVKESQAEAMEPPVPIRLIEADSDWSCLNASHVFVCRSPDYTPVESNILLPTLTRLIRA